MGLSEISSTCTTKLVLARGFLICGGEGGELMVRVCVCAVYNCESVYMRGGVVVWWRGWGNFEYCCRLVSENC